MPSDIALRILRRISARRARSSAPLTFRTASPARERALVAIAGIALVSCSSPQSTSGSASGPSGGGVITSDDPPWEDKIKEGDSREDMLSRTCWPKSTIWAGAPGAAGAPGSNGSSEPAQTGCPTIADLGTLGYTRPSSPQDMTGSVVSEGPIEWSAQCCYLESHWHVGRPYVVDGVQRAAGPARRADWAEHRLDGPRAAPGAARRTTRDRALAEAWLRDARLEHASVASFAVFALDLLALGAPAELVARAHRAALDEIDHATRCFALASGYAGEPLGPGALLTGVSTPRPSLCPVDAAATRLRASPGEPGELRPRCRDARLAEAVDAAIREGCVAETRAALLAEAQQHASDDAASRAALAKIAIDEADHAALAFDFVAWALEQGGASTRSIVERALSDATERPLDAARAADDPRLSRADVERVSEEAARIAATGLAALLEPADLC